MSRARKGTIAWELVAGQWMQRTAAFILSLTLVEALHAQSSTSITNPTLVNGNVTWTDLGGGNWQFQVGSQTAIINFTSFGIPNGAVVEFLMNPNMRVLNRVLGDFPTEINGQLLASGQIFIVNPAGVFIGANGVVNVGSLYAAAGDISDAAFDSGNFQFTNVRGEISNAGLIQATDSVALVGTRVVNLGVGPTRGIVVGPGGVALMVAHNGDVTVFEPGANPQLFAVAGGGANIGGVGVDNSGRVEVGTGGRIQLGAGDVYSVAVRNTGELRTQDGEIRMVGNTIEQSGGQLSAGALIVGGNAGAATQMTVSGDVNADVVEINAGTVALNGATKFAGQAGQGTSVFLIGDVRSVGGPQTLTFDMASALVTGNLGGAGAERINDLTATGDLNVLSSANVAGNLSVDGIAAVNGDLNLAGDAAVGAALLVGGSLNLDGAAAQTVSAVGDIDVSGALTSVNDATVTGSSVAIGGGALSGGALSLNALSGNVTVVGDTTAGTNLTVTSGGGDVALGGNVSAGGNALVFGNSVDITGNATTTSGTLTLASSAGNVSVGGNASAGADLNVSAGADVVVGGNAEAAGSVVIFGQAVSVAGDASAAGGTLSVSSVGSTTIGGNASASTDVAVSSGGAANFGGDIDAGTDVNVTAGGPVSVAGNVVAGDEVLLTSAAGFTFGGNVSALNNIAINASGTAVNFNGAGSQSVNSTAGALVIDGVVTKGDDDLNLSAGTTIDVTGAMDVGGSLTAIAGGAATFGADVTAGDSVSLFGDSVSITGNVEATAGALNVSSGLGNVSVGGNASAGTDVFVTTGGDVSVGGDLSAGGSALVFGNSVSIVGNATTTTGAMTLASGAGDISVGGNVDSGADLNVFSGGNVNLGGDASAAGNALVSGNAVAISGNAAAGGGVLNVSSIGNTSIGGNASASTDVVLNSGADLSVGGDVLAANAVTLSGANVSVTGAVQATAGALNLNATAGDASVGGNASAGTDIVVSTVGAATFGAAVDAGNDVSLTAGGALSAGSVSAGNAASLVGSSVAVAGSAQAAAGALNVTTTAGNASIGGDASAGTDVNVTVTGGNAILGGDVTAANNVSILGNAVSIVGNATATNGALSVSSGVGAVSVGGNASAGTDVFLTTGGDITVGGDVSAVGNAFIIGGSVDVVGNASATNGVLTIASSMGNVAVGGNASAGSDLNVSSNGNVNIGGDATAVGSVLVFGNNVSVVGNLAATNGALSVSSGGDASVGGNTSAGTDIVVNSAGAATFGGTVDAGNNVSLNGDAITVSGNVSAGNQVLLSAASAITLGGDVNGVNNVTIDANGGAVTFNGAAGQTVRSDSGALLIDGAVSKTGGDLTLFAGAALDVTGAMNVSGSLNSTSSGVSTFGGNVTTGDDLTVSASSIQLFGDLAGGSDAGDTITLNGPIVLNAADSRWSAHGIRVNGSINGAAPGAQTLRLAAGDRSILNGGIGNTARLGEFRIEDGFTQLGSVSGGLFVVNADRFVLAPASRPSNVGVDLASSGNLVFNTTQFTMAQGTKATVLGNFTINNGAGTARLSDVNTTGVFEVNAGQIVLVARPAGSSFTSIGGTLDTGLDFVSLGGFRFSVAPILDGAGLARFASPNATGDLNGNLIDFVMLNLNDADLGISSLTGGFGIVGADFFDGANFFDLIADGTANTSSATTIAALAPQETRGAREAGGVALSVSERRQLEALLGGAIEIRLPDVPEILEIGTGSVAFRDQGRAEVAALASSSASETVAASGRSTDWRRPLPSVVQRFSGARVQDLLETSEALRKVSRESASAFSAAAGSLANAYAGQEPLAAVVDRARSAGNAAELDALRVIGRWVKLGEELGLSTAERLRAGDPASKTLWPQTTVALEGGIEFKVPASAFDAEFWMALDRPVASK
jgi:filamentous hemagglutinin family protein